MPGHKNKSAAECIGFRYGQDMKEVSDNRYQAGKQKFPVYTMFNGYVCCPPAGSPPPADPDWDWKPDGEAYGRTVYFSKAKTAELQVDEWAKINMPGTKYHGRRVLVVKFLEGNLVHIHIGNDEFSIERDKLKA